MKRNIGSGLGFSEGSGQGEDIHLFRIRFKQDLRALLDCRPGGEDVVDEQDMFFCNGLGPADLEGATDIFLPF